MSFPTPLAITIEASSFYAELTERGVTLYATDEGKIRYRPRSALSPEDVKSLREYKGEVLQLLGYGENLSSPTVLSSPTPSKADTYGDLRGTIPGDDTPESIVPPFVKAERERRTRDAAALGLVARWSYEHGYISLHDPTTGEWHDVPVKGAPEWARNEALRRKRGVVWADYSEEE